MSRRIFKFLFKCQNDQEKTCFSTFKRRILCFCLCAESIGNDIKGGDLEEDIHSEISSCAVNFSKNKKMAAAAKRCKIEQGKLWTHEPRMWAEKFFYLNKSTTKYVIVGLEPETFRPLVRICDRVTGKYISIPQAQFEAFHKVIAKIINGTYTLNGGYIEGEEVADSGMKFASTANGIWRIADALTSIQIHSSSLKSFLRTIGLIRHHIVTYNHPDFAGFVDQIRFDTKDLTPPEADTYLYDTLENTTKKVFEEKFVKEIWLQVIFDLICNNEYYTQSICC